MATEPDFSDRKVRDMLSRAGFDPMVNDDVTSFARFMRSMFAEYESANRVREAKRTTLTLATASILSAIVTMLAPWLAHHFGLW